MLIERVRFITNLTCHLHLTCHTPLLRVLVLMLMLMLMLLLLLMLVVVVLGRYLDSVSKGPNGEVSGDQVEAQVSVGTTTRVGFSPSHASPSHPSPSPAHPLTPRPHPSALRSSSTLTLTLTNPTLGQV